MNVRRSLVGSAAVVVTALALAACSGGSGPAGGTPAAGGGSVGAGSGALTQGGGSTPVKGGTLVYGDVSPVTWPIGGSTRFTNVAVWNSLVDELTYLPSGGETVQPWLASKFSSNSDFTQWQFTIRQGVTFSDGTALTAQVVKDNFDRWGLGDAKLGFAPDPDLVGYKSATVAGDVVTVNLASPNRFLPFALTQTTHGIVGEAYLKDSLTQQSDPKTIVGSGPFTFASQVPNQEVILKKRAGYNWAPPGDPNQGPAYLDEIDIKVIGELGLRAQAVESGQVQAAKGVQPTDESRLASEGFVIHAVYAPQTTPDILSLRPGNPQLSDVRVRQALQYATDRGALSEQVLTSSYPPAYSTLITGYPGNTHDFSKDLAYNPAKANQLLDAAGWVKGSDGLRHKDGQTLTVTIAASSQSSAVEPATAFLAQQWQQVIGVKVVNEAGNDTFFTAAGSSTSTGGKISRSSTDLGLYSSFAGAKNANTLWDDPKLDALFAQDRAAKTPAEIAKITAEEIQTLLFTDAVAIPLYQPGQVTATSSKVHLTFSGYTAAQFQAAWVAQ